MKEACSFSRHSQQNGEMIGRTSSIPSVLRHIEISRKEGGKFYCIAHNTITRHLISAHLSWNGKHEEDECQRCVELCSVGIRENGFKIDGRTAATGRRRTRGFADECRDVILSLGWGKWTVVFFVCAMRTTTRDREGCRTSHRRRSNHPIWLFSRAPFSQWKLLLESHRDQSVTPHLLLREEETFGNGGRWITGFVSWFFVDV